jgi:hypothetical protein
VRLPQHRVGLAHARRRADVDAELGALFGFQARQDRLGIGRGLTSGFQIRLPRGPPAQIGASLMPASAW